jgi:hypothetical protein
MSADLDGLPDWSDYEPRDAIEVVGLALIGAGIWTDDPAGGPGVLMDLDAAAEVVEALRAAGYLDPALQQAVAHLRVMPPVRAAAPDPASGDTEPGETA